VDLLKIKKLTQKLLYPIYVIFLLLIRLLCLLVPLLKRRSTNKKSVVFYAAFFPGNAGYHWRVKKWAEILADQGYQVSIQVLWNERQFTEYKQEVDYLKTICFVTKRVIQIFRCSDFHYAIVRRQPVPYFDHGMNFLEKAMSNLHRELILDIDDDLAESKKEPIVRNFTTKLLGVTQRPFTNSLKYYKRFIVGNRVLKEKLTVKFPSLKENRDVLVIPTCYEPSYNLSKTYKLDSEKLTIGWLGSDGNQYVLDDIITELNDLNRIKPFELRVVSGKIYQNAKANFKITNRKWSLTTEKQELLEFDIGIMPLSGKPHEKGKSGFKLIQYMSVGLVAIASNLGINNEIIKDGENGWLVDVNQKNWNEKILLALQENSRWPEIGQNAKNTIVKEYSFSANTEKLLEFFSPDKNKDDE